MCLGTSEDGRASPEKRIGLGSGSESLEVFGFVSCTAEMGGGCTGGRADLGGYMSIHGVFGSCSAELVRMGDEWHGV